MPEAKDTDAHQKLFAAQACLKKSRDPKLELSSRLFWIREAISHVIEHLGGPSRASLLREKEDG